MRVKEGKLLQLVFLRFLTTQRVICEIHHWWEPEYETTIIQLECPSHTDEGTFIVEPPPPPHSSFFKEEMSLLESSEETGSYFRSFIFNTSKAGTHLSSQWQFNRISWKHQVSWSALRWVTFKITCSIHQQLQCEAVKVPLNDRWGTHAPAKFLWLLTTR